ncbi:hypothetical protein [Streptomyces sp. NPDC047028]|uniref:hypothetical protein n=1 Tax=Streptomyces sp. NPDC047028 TaxID=3155793 RepID=UPI00340962B9
MPAAARWCAAGTRAGRRTAVVALVLGALAALPGGPTATAAGGLSYGFTPGDLVVGGATGTAGAPLLEPGRTYRGSIPPGGRLYYRLELHAGTTAYVPVTAVPPAGATVAATDGIRVSVKDAHGGSCSYASEQFGAGLSPRPVTAVGQRQAGKAVCQGAGTYYVLVERLDSGGTGAEASGRPGASGGPGASGDTTGPVRRWGLEIAPVTEPALAKAGATSAPGGWNSASPEPVTGQARWRSGGTGFAFARPLGPGVWQTRITPGETLFYKVPADWGQQLAATAELGGSSGGHGYVGGALNLALYNPVRGSVDNAALGYTGTAKTTALDPAPPVEYANRYAPVSGVSSVRFAGDYYLVLHLSTRMSDTFGAGPLTVTLRVRVDGRAHDGPGYAGKPVPAGVFTVTPGDRLAAEPGGAGGTGGSGGGGDPAMKVVAACGIGAGTALLLVLGVWTVVARRAQPRASAQKPTA